MSEKAHTLKGLQSEMARLRKSIDGKKAQVKKLTDSIKAETKRLKDCEAAYKKLSNEQLQKQIAETWFKDDSMSKEQISKILAISEQIKDKIDVLDVNAVVNAVTAAYNDQKVDEGTAPDTTLK